MKRGMCPNCFLNEYIFDNSFINGKCQKCGYSMSSDKLSLRALYPATKLNHGKYIIGRTLGEGGFGITYKAVDLVNGGICCIKEYVPFEEADRIPNSNTLKPRANKANEFKDGLDKFRREMSALNVLRGVDGVVQFRDQFDENGTAYYVMEYLDGWNFTRFISMAKPTYSMITEIVLKVAKILMVMHEKTHPIYHRDISPENIYISNNKVYLIDFGNAKVIILDSDRRDTRLIFKPGFGAPEQADFNAPQGAYTDVYGLASSYYFALTGLRIPSAMDRKKGAIYTSLFDLDKNIPKEISDAVDRALRMDVNSRTGSVREFVEEICRTNRLSVIPKFKIVHGLSAGTEGRLNADKDYVIGREACDIVINWMEISKSHVIIRYNSYYKYFEVTDTSTNGTFVDGIRLEKGRTYKMYPETTLVLGNNISRISLDASYLLN
jgi:putative non-specific serine/threonine protein kinase